jgi:glycosyltransferase involved in cell wall biosynthesis
MKENMNVSVVIAVYNGSKYIREQLESLVHQTYPIFELIIQDDNSTDNTFEILQEYVRNYPYVRVFRNENRKGMNENFFSAMERAAGDYIAICDADDIWELDKLENQITQIGDNWLCSGFSKPFSETERLDFDSRVPNYKIERLIHIASCLPGHTMLIKRDIIPLILRFRTFPFIYDHIISLVIGSYDKITFVNKVLVNYRVHQTSATYTVPVMSRSGKGNRRLPNIIRSVFRTFSLYIEIKGKMSDWFKMVLQILQSLPVENSMNMDAQKIALYQSQKGMINCLKLICIYIKMRKKIFHVEEKNVVLSILRAIYFPVSCSDYFRYMSRHYNRKLSNI